MQASLMSLWKHNRSPKSTFSNQSTHESQLANSHQLHVLRLDGVVDIRSTVVLVTQHVHGFGIAGPGRGQGKAFQNLMIQLQFAEQVYPRLFELSIQV